MNFHELNIPMKPAPQSINRNPAPSVPLVLFQSLSLQVGNLPPNPSSHRSGRLLLNLM